MRKSLLSHLCVYSTFLTAVSAFSVTVGSPTQCDPLAVSWTGGQAPFQVLLTPFNQTLLNSSIPASAFSNGQGSYSIPQLPLATGTQFLLTMSDATGFATGGTTSILTVGAPIAHNNCNTTGSQDFYFSTSNTIQQCSPYTFSYYGGAVLPATITGLIPGGGHVVIYPVITSSYTWTADVQEGTEIVFYMTDSRPGVGQGGVDIIKQVANSTDASCLNANSPSSTSSASSQTTSPSTASQTQSNNNTSNVGIIAGAAGGGVVLLVLLIILGVYCRRKRSRSLHITFPSQHEARQFRHGGDDRGVIEDGQTTEKFTHQTNRVSRPILNTQRNQQDLRHVSYTDSFAGSSSISSASRRATAIGDQMVPSDTLPRQTLPFGLAAPVHPGTHSHFPHTSVGDFVTNDPHASLGQMRPSRLSSNTDVSTGYGDAGSSSVSSVNRRMPVLPHHMSASSFTVSTPPSSSDPTQASRPGSDVNGFTMHANARNSSASQALSLDNRYQTTSVHFASSNQPGIPSASNFPVSDSSSRPGSNIDVFARHEGPRSYSVPSSDGRAAGASATNPSAQIIRHTDMGVIRALADVQEVIELPPEYTERPFSSAEAAEGAAAGSASIPDQKL